MILFIMGIKYIKSCTKLKGHVQDQFKEKRKHTHNNDFNVNIKSE